MAKCTICGRNVGTSVTEWDLNPKVIKMFEWCGKKFCEYMKR